MIEFGQLDDDGDLAASAPLVGLRLAPVNDEMQDGADIEQDETDFELAEQCGPEEQLDAIKDQLASLEVGEPPRPATSVEVSHSANPFAESFDEEEVIVDRFPSAHAAVWDQMPHVYSTEGRVLAALLEPFVQTAKPIEAPAAVAWADAETENLIVVEDDPVLLPAARPATDRVYRQEYSQLFAKLGGRPAA